LLLLKFTAVGVVIRVSICLSIFWIVLAILSIILAICGVILAICRIIGGLVVISIGIRIDRCSVHMSAGLVTENCGE